MNFNIDLSCFFVKRGFLLVFWLFFYGLSAFFVVVLFCSKNSKIVTCIA